MARRFLDTFARIGLSILGCKAEEPGGCNEEGFAPLPRSAWSSSSIFRRVSTGPRVSTNRRSTWPAVISGSFTSKISPRRADFESPVSSNHGAEVTASHRGLSKNQGRVNRLPFFIRKLPCGCRLPPPSNSNLELLRYLGAWVRMRLCHPR